MTVYFKFSSDEKTRGIYYIDSRPQTAKVAATHKAHFIFEYRDGVTYYYKNRMGDNYQYSPEEMLFIKLSAKPLTKSYSELGIFR